MPNEFLHVVDVDGQAQDIKISDITDLRVGNSSDYQEEEQTDIGVPCTWIGILSTSGPAEEFFVEENRICVTDTVESLKAQIGDVIKLLALPKTNGQTLHVNPLLHETAIPGDAENESWLLSPSGEFEYLIALSLEDLRTAFEESSGEKYVIIEGSYGCHPDTTFGDDTDKKSIDHDSLETGMHLARFANPAIEYINNFEVAVHFARPDGKPSYTIYAMELGVSEVFDLLEQRIAHGTSQPAGPQASNI